MRSWTFVIGVAAMGIASIAGYQMTVVRDGHQVEMIANQAASESDIVPHVKGTSFYALASSPNRALQCASCHTLRPQDRVLSQAGRAHKVSFH